MNLNPDQWQKDFKALLDLPPEADNTFTIGTFTPETVPDLVIQFIEQQSFNHPALNIPTFDDYKGWFTNPPKPPTPPNKTEISIKADKKFFGYEPDRELWKEFRYKLELADYEKELIQFEQSLNQFQHFVRVNKKTEKGYLLYLKLSFPSIQKFLETPFERTLKFEDRFKHCYITGNTGSGKSELIKQLVYPFLIEKNPSSAVVVVDPKADLALEITQMKELYHNDRLVYIDPFLDDKKVPVINPFSMGMSKLKAESPELRKAIDKTSQALIDVFEEMLLDAGGATLTTQMNALVFPCLYALLKEGDKSFADLQDFMKEEKNPAMLAKGKKSTIKAHREFFENSFNLTGYKTTKHGIYTKILSLINSPIFYDCIMGKSTIDLDECLQQKKIIIFNIPKTDMGVSSSQAFGRFILARVLAFAMNQSSINKQKRINVHLIIDECQNYISSFYSTILTETRKYKLFLTLAQQWCGQDMKPKLLKDVLSSSNLMFTGLNDPDNLKKLSATTGADIEELEALKQGVFHFKLDKNLFENPSLPIKVPTNLLGSSNAMTAEQWEVTRQQQLDKYYRFTEEFEPQQETILKPKTETKPEKLNFGYDY